MGSQWPHQPRAPHTQAYSQYPQQFAQQYQQPIPQQHHPQLPPQHQPHFSQPPQQYSHHFPASYVPQPSQQSYGPQQSQGQYRPPYQQAAPPSRPPQIARPSLPTCYNCGSPEHLAQSCPEPRREIPAGSLLEQNNPRPFKRQKPNAPVVTKYAVPQASHPSYGQSPSYGSSPYAQSGYPHQQSPYGPPTPVSAYPQQWQQAQQHSPYQPQFSHGPPPQHPYGHGTQPPPTPIASVTPHYPSPLSAQGQHHGTTYPLQSTSYHQPQVYRPPSTSSSSPIAQYSPHQPLLSPRHVSSHTSYQRNRQHSSDRTVAYKSESTTPKPQVSTIAEIESEEDELKGLDIYDIPDTPGDLRLPAWQPTHSIVRALPSDFVVAEAIIPIEPLHPPVFEDDGQPPSKYFAHKSSDEVLENIRQSKYWSGIQDDPAFHSIPDNGEFVSVTELTSYLNTNHHSQGSLPSEKEVHVKEEPEEEDGELTQDIPDAPNKAEGTRDVMYSLEHALNRDDCKPSSKPRRDLETERARLQRAQAKAEAELARAREARLAALGVTGTSKPVRAPARPWPPPDTSSRSMRTVTSEVRRSRSTSPREYNNSRDISVSNSASTTGEHDPYFQTDDYNDNEAGSPHHLNDDNKYTPDLGRAHSTPVTEKGGSAGPPPPRPSLPPRRTSANYDGMNDSPPTSGSNHGYSNGYADSYGEPRNDLYRYSADGQSSSPVKPRSGGANGRKRDYDQRDDSSEDERENERRRQEDDVTPKIRRRQPKVAEAYSRRW